MSEAEATDFDTEFDAAREAEEADEAGLEQEGEEAAEEEGEEPEAEAAEEQPKAVADAEKLSKTVKNLDRALRDERRQKRELSDRLAQLEARVSAPQPQAQADPGAMPDPNADPIGWMQAAQKLIDRMQQQDSEQAQRSQAQTQQQREFQRLNEQVTEAEADFKAEHPDYDDAAKHLKQSILDELGELGLAGGDLQAEFQKRMVGIAQRALAAGKDPAEVAYNLSKKRGFGVDKAATSLQKIARGQQTARSLPSGGRPNGHLPVSEGVRLKGAAFDKWFEAEKRKQSA
jgi:hypothetical protein